MAKEEYRSSPEVRTGFVKGNTFGYRPVQYSVIDGEAIFEGDIVLGRVDEMERLVAEEKDTTARGVVITGAQFRWPGGVVPFTIDSALPDVVRVNDAIAHWLSRTRIRLVARTNEQNFVTFRPGDACSSSLGMRGGEQFITLAPECDNGNTIHEIGHTVGLWHEQSREDRDRFIRILPENIKAGEEHNFNQHITDGDDVGRYDFGSIMHYGEFAFSKNGNPTIETLKLNVESIGQRSGLSDGDVQAVNVLSISSIWPNGKAYFFKGSQYARWDPKLDKIDSGYPKPLSAWNGFPAGFAAGVNAAVVWDNGKMYFFKGKQYLRHDIAADKVDPGYPKDIASEWPGLWPDGIDAMVRWPNGKAYAFKGANYLRYDITTDRTDPGYPRRIKDGWPGFPASFAAGVDAAVVWNNGKAYFFKGGEYVRYDIAKDKTDSGYPRAISAGWRGLWGKDIDA